jgi:hypothetical protein
MASAPLHRRDRIVDHDLFAMSEPQGRLALGVGPGEIEQCLRIRLDLLKEQLLHRAADQPQTTHLEQRFGGRIHVAQAEITIEQNHRTVEMVENLSVETVWIHVSAMLHAIKQSKSGANHFARGERGTPRCARLKAMLLRGWFAAGRRREED